MEKTAPRNYLSEAGLNRRIEWIELCRVNIRQTGGSCCRRKCTRRDCQSTKKYEILETKITHKGLANCNYNTKNIAAGTDLFLFEYVQSKYEVALSLALKNNDTIGYNKIISEMSSNLFSIKTNMQFAGVSAEACMSKGFYGAGGWCNELILMGRVRLY